MRETKNDGSLGLGISCSRSVSYSRSAFMTLSCSGTSRDLPNLVSRMCSTPSVQSMSSRSSLIASPMRRPAAASSPIRRVIGRRPQRLADRLLRRGHDRRDVGVGVEEDLAPALVVGHQAQRGHLGGRVGPAQVAGEPANGGDPPGAGRRDHLGLAGLHPVQGGGDGHGLLAAVVQEGREVRQQIRCLVHLVPQRTAEPQVVIDCLAKIGHAAPPGQGCATARSAVKSTFA